jgi:Fe-S cluster biosynthesis and repair protein YggX
MADTNARIEQFKKMANDDPNNELGHFSLGRAYLEGGLVDGAIASFQRVIELNPNMSRAYQLLATAVIQKGETSQAIEYLTKGVQVANERGDLMPKNDMIRTLRELGAPVPEMKRAEAQQPVSEGEVFCSRCGKIGPRMAEAPFRNAQGKEIHEKVCAPCFREWVGMGTKVINEMRLPLSDPQAQKIYDQHMMEFLNLR